MSTRLLARPRTRLTATGNAGATLAAAFVLALSTAGCGVRQLPDLPTPPSMPEPDPSSVETVLFLLGDTGKTPVLDHPVLGALKQDVARWSAALDRDSAVVVVVMGDIVYPDGVHAPGEPGYANDSASVAAQVDVLGTPAARRSAIEYFVAGNHDWGLRDSWPGAVRLNHLDALLDTLHAAGHLRVSLQPAAGEGGPSVIDFGTRLRLILLDTAWWLLGPDPSAKPDVLRRTADAVRTAGQRNIVFVAHHPFQSAGAHGGTVPFWKSLGVRFLLNRAGALLEDLNSRPYRKLRQGLGTIFEEHGRPLLFAGGHDHSIQLIEGPEPGTPRWSLVDGATSKLTPAGYVDGMIYRRSEPGYAKVFFLRDGSAQLVIQTAPVRFLSCTGTDAARQRCMADGARAFAPSWSGLLR